MFQYFFNSFEQRPEPHDPVIDQVVASHAGLHLNTMNTSLREIHEKVPKTFWNNWFNHQRFSATSRYRWQNNDWRQIEKSEMPIFELIKYSPML